MVGVEVSVENHVGIVCHKGTYKKKKRISDQGRGRRSPKGAGEKEGREKREKKKREEKKERRRRKEYLVELVLPSEEGLRFRKSS
jgi:hypothetical protein